MKVSDEKLGNRVWIGLIKHDLMVGIGYSWKKFIPIIMIMILACAQFYQETQLYLEATHQDLSLSMADYLVDVFKGMEIYIPSKDDPFQIPAIWLLLNVYLAYLVASYPAKDMASFGQQIMIRSQSRRKWWLSKCLWNIITVLVFYSLIFATIFVFSLLTGEVTLVMHNEINEQVSEITTSHFTTGKLLEVVGVLTILTSMALSLLEMLLSFLIKAVYSFTIIVVVLSISAFYCHPLLIGNYLMIMRNNFIISNQGVDSAQGMVISLLIILLSTTIGYIKLKSSDIF